MQVRLDRDNAQYEKPMEKPYQLNIVLRINFYRINSHCSSSWLSLRLENAGNSPPAPLASQLGDVAILYLWYGFPLEKPFTTVSPTTVMQKSLAAQKKNYLAFSIAKPV